MPPQSIVLKGGLTARHFSIIEFLVLEGGTNEAAAEKFDVELAELVALRQHPLWKKQERSLVKEEKQEYIQNSIEDLYPTAVDVLKDSLEAVKFNSIGQKLVDHRTRFAAASKCIDLMIATTAGKGSDKALDIYIPEWMKDHFKVKKESNNGMAKVSKLPGK